MIKDHLIATYNEGWLAVSSASIDGYKFTTCHSMRDGHDALRMCQEGEEQPEIGEGTKIWHFTHIRSGAKIGKNCVIGQGCYIGEKAVIGDGCKIQNNVSIYSEVTLEDNVFVGPSVVFTNDKNPRAEYPKHGKWLSTLIKKGVTIGANATLLPVIIGRYAMIGAGALVTKDVPDNAVVVGNPAKITSWICECGRPLIFKWTGKKLIIRCLGDSPVFAEENRCNKKWNITDEMMWWLFRKEDKAIKETFIVYQNESPKEEEEWIRKLRTL